MVILMDPMEVRVKVQQNLLSRTETPFPVAASKKGTTYVSNLGSRSDAVVGGCPAIGCQVIRELELAMAMAEPHGIPGRNHQLKVI